MAINQIDSASFALEPASHQTASQKYFTTWACPPAILSLFSINLSYLLQGGVSLESALKIAHQSETSPGFKKLIGNLIESVQTGSMMSDAMRVHAAVFGDVSIALVEAAEKDGTLGITFADIARLINTEAANRDRLKHAMAYPTLLAIVVSLTLVFMVTHLAPVVKPLLLSIGVQPSVATQAVFWLAEDGFIVVLFIAMLPGLLFLVWVLARINVDAKLFWHRFVLSIWIVGGISRDLHYARLCRVIARLLDSGLVLDESITVASKSIDNAFVYCELQEARRRMQVGISFSESLKLSTTSPMILVPLINAAETSGEIAVALQQASVQLDQQARIRLDRFTSLVPPALVCILGVILLSLVTGLLAPIFNSALTMGVEL